MKKKNTFLRIAAAMLALGVLTGATFASNTTLAKYTATASGAASSAQIAKFSVIVGATDIATNSTIASLDLFSTILDTAATTETTGTQNGQGWANADNDVATSKIAPGTHGQFELSLQNLSDVTVDVTLAAASGGTAFPATANIEWYAQTTNTGVPTTTYSTLSDALDAATGATSGAIRLAKNGSASTTYYVGWLWLYEGASATVQDAADTALGTAATPITPSFTLNATATQVD
jgi:hypothetical protein